LSSSSFSFAVSSSDFYSSFHRPRHHHHFLLFLMLLFFFFSSFSDSFSDSSSSSSDSYSSFYRRRRRRHRHYHLLLLVLLYLLSLFFHHHHHHQQQQQGDNEAVSPIRMIEKNQLQLFGVIGQGAFGIVLKGLASLKNSNSPSRDVLPLFTYLRRIEAMKEVMCFLEQSILSVGLLCVFISSF